MKLRIYYILIFPFVLAGLGLFQLLLELRSVLGFEALEWGQYTLIFYTGVLAGVLIWISESGFLYKLFKKYAGGEMEISGRQFTMLIAGHQVTGYLIGFIGLMVLLSYLDGNHFSIFSLFTELRTPAELLILFSLFAGACFLSVRNLLRHRGQRPGKMNS